MKLPREYKKLSRKAQMNLYIIFEWIMIALGIVGICIGQHEMAMFALLVAGQLRIEDKLDSLLSLCEEADTVERTKKEIKKEERNK